MMITSEPHGLPGMQASTRNDFMKSKTVLTGVITIVHGFSPMLNDEPPNWVQIQLGFGMIFLRQGVKKAEDAAVDKV